MAKFVITGGHHNSALVVARELTKKGHRVEWIGHRYAANGDTNDSAEYIEVKASGIPFHDLVAGKSSLHPKNIINIPLGLFRAGILVSKIRPDAVISFGGYLGLATIVPAWIKKIPVYIHEQTAVAGKANKIAGWFARRIYLTWNSSRSYYPPGKTLVVGLPLRPSLTISKQLPPLSRPTILILCGKQGSHVINNVVLNRLQDLLARYNVVHQTGMSSVTGDYQRALALKESLPPELANRYEPQGYIVESEIARYLNSADIVVGRSGAHTTYELAILGKKSILIPLLSTHGREQLHNARVLEQAGIAIILPQSELSFPRLEHSIKLMLDRVQPSPLHLPLNASDTMIRDLLDDLKRR